ncbi:MAG: cyclic nucleotide-binding domain-containing protein, partial [Acidimicrobiaceae bacterium]|nr:cyclic nucleotide-binding domain-containing protein [Acidimicrobiaceae bacterium]
GQTVAHLAAGEFLGELAVISGTPRTATVTATSPMIIEILNRREFMALLDESATLGRKILVGAVKRLQMNERTKTN